MVQAVLGKNPLELNWINNTIDGKTNASLKKKEEIKTIKSPKPVIKTKPVAEVAGVLPKNKKDRASGTQSTSGEKGTVCVRWNIPEDLVYKLKLKALMEKKRLTETITNILQAGLT